MLLLRVCKEGEVLLRIDLGGLWRFLSLKHGDEEEDADADGVAVRGEMETDGDVAARTGRAGGWAWRR